MKTKNKMSAKILSFVLSLMLMAGMAQVVLAAEDTDYSDAVSTSDEYEEEIYEISLDYDTILDNSVIIERGYKIGDKLSEDDFNAFIEQAKFTLTFSDGSQTKATLTDKGLSDGKNTFPCEISYSEIIYDHYMQEPNIIISFELPYTALDTEIDFEYDNAMSPVKSIEITKAPDNTEFAIWGPEDSLWQGLEMLITFNDGSTYNYAYDEDFTMPNIGDYYVEIYIEEDLYSLSVGKNIITYNYFGCTATQEINAVIDPAYEEEMNNPIVDFEIIKVPDKVFTAPLYTGSYEEFVDSINDSNREEAMENSISLNMAGAQVAVIRADGKREIYTFGKAADYENLAFAFYEHSYQTKPFDVIDLGNYKAKINFIGIDKTFTANHGTAPSDSALTDSATGITVSGNVGEGVTLNVKAAEVAGAKAAYDITLVKDGKEVQPNGDITVSIPYSQGGFKVVWVKDDKTQQDMNAKYENGKYVFTSNHLSTYAIVASSTSTNDTLNGGTSTDNGTVQTGDMSSAAIVLVMLLSATAVIFFTYRRRLGK